MLFDSCLTVSPQCLVAQCLSPQHSYAVPQAFC
uniref:Uncharacterized protein n=1 Tax=Anguilla anguilla TaxID=7936 RepID=A0A0E9SXH6_ANGAN